MINIICKTCKTEFHVSPHRAKTAVFCSYSCRNEGYKGRPAIFVPETKPRIKQTCQNCGKTFEVQQSRMAHGRGKHCSSACQYASKKAAPKKVVSFKCLNCEKVFDVEQSKVGRQKGIGKYCCRKCRDAHRHGENHPQYLNGTAQEKRGPNWQAQKRKAKRRDKWICQHCKMTHKQSMEKFGQTLQVHHIRPYRLFETYLEANELANLITLCAACHRTAEADFQRTEREG